MNQIIYELFTSRPTTVFFSDAALLQEKRKTTSSKIQVWQEICNSWLVQSSQLNNSSENDWSTAQCLRQQVFQQKKCDSLRSLSCPHALLIVSHKAEYFTIKKAGLKLWWTQMGRWYFKIFQPLAMKVSVSSDLSSVKSNLPLFPAFLSHPLNYRWKLPSSFSSDLWILPPPLCQRGFEVSFRKFSRDFFSSAASFWSHVFFFWET